MWNETRGTLRRRALAALLFVLTAACSQKKPSVIVISVDTLRADHLPAYGYLAGSTPAIDALRRDGVLFASAWSHCPMTLPSHVSMLTGLLPTEHGVRNNIGFTFDASRHPTIAQALHANGYATGAAVSAFVLRGRTGLAKAFDQYDDVDDPSRSQTALDLERPGTATVKRAIEFVERQNDKPFFLFVHLFEPHAPYEGGYDREISRADEAVGQLLAALKQRKVYDDSLIILTSDHGEGLGDHGEKQHSVLLYAEQLRVPLIIKLPKNERAKRTVASTVQHADLASTIAGVTGVAFQSSPTARNVFAAQTERAVYSETLYPRIHLGWSELYSALDGVHHYIGGPRPELYDLKADPRETNDLAAVNRRETARLRAVVEQRRTAVPQTTAVDPDVAASLGALGYIGNVSHAPAEGPLLNPRDHIGEYESMRDDLADSIAVQSALQGNDVVAAREHALRITSRPAASAAALLMAAKVYLRDNDGKHAIALLNDAERRAGGAMPQLDLVRGNAYAGLGRFAEAEKAYLRETRAFPKDSGAFATLAALYFAMNDSARGRATLQAMFDANHTRAVAELASRTAAAVEDMEEARRWRSIAAEMQ